MGARAGRRGSGSRSTRRRRKRWSPRSASASSGCCASWRSWRWKATADGGGAPRTVDGRGHRGARRAVGRVARLRARRRARRPATAPLATRTYLRLREQGERVAGLTYLLASRLREAAGASPRSSRRARSAADVKQGLRMPPKAAERLIADVARSDPAAAARARSGRSRDLELDTRGGAALTRAIADALAEMGRGRRSLTRAIERDRAR